MSVVYQQRPYYYTSASVKYISTPQVRKMETTAYHTVSSEMCTTGEHPIGIMLRFLQIMAISMKVVSVIVHRNYTNRYI